MDVKCYNKKCLYIWDYRGEQKRFICCPKCRFKRIFDKCRTFFLSKNDILPLKNNISSDRPNDIHKRHTPLRQDSLTEFEIIKDSDGFEYHVDKSIALQFKEAHEKPETLTEETVAPGIEPGSEEEPVIKILPPKFEIIRVIPRDSVKILEYQTSFL